MRLYEVPTELATVQALIDECDGELPPELEARLDAIVCDMEFKVTAICKLRAEYAGEADAAMAESKRLHELASGRMRNADRMKKYLLDTLQAAGIKKLDYPLFKLSVCKNSRPTTEVTAPVDELPLVLVKVVKMADTQKAYDLFKTTGVVPPGFRFTEGVHLRIT